MILLWVLMLSAAPNSLSGSSWFCADPEDSSQHAGHVIDCLGPRFTWLHAVFDNLPSLLSFVSRLRCSSGPCPRDLEDYGCSCRYAPSGNPVDPLDSCCAAHRRCYQNAAPCRQQLPPYNFSCSAANTSCDAADPCQQRLCECDQAAIDCVTRSPYNSTLRGLSESFCSAGEATDPLGGGGVLEDGEVFGGADVRSAANGSAADLLSNSSLLAAGEVDVMGAGGNRTYLAETGGEGITGPPEPTFLLTPPGTVTETAGTSADRKLTQPVQHFPEARILTLKAFLTLHQAAYFV
ncbi:otoconin-90 [Fundulus heteroclitus]|uniref:otoconin-90 n=1 Tax=Fundulus heteroclitus TaxID=8078 RepID=UPI00165CBC62|nr:otoconin-90 [Fundulus heteroclitus]